MPDQAPRPSRVLTNLHHGGSVVVAAPPRAVADVPPHAVPDEGIPLDAVVQDAGVAPPVPDTTPFGYLFDDLRQAYPAAHLPVEPTSTVVTALKALGSAMVEAPPPDDPGFENNSTIPPVYTYWGQFVDHDVTANTDREAVIAITGDPLTPLPPAAVLSTLRNLRQPALNLDSVYGDGPFVPDGHVPYDGITFRVGDLVPADHDIVQGPWDPVPGFDLPRTAAGTALIGDARDDENLVVAQLHVAFLKFHNNVVGWLADHETGLADDHARFDRARRLTRWHYQSIVVDDFLRTIAGDGAVDAALAGPVRVTTSDGEPFMPLEHAVAAYRFGHSMVRGRYDHNENFGRTLDGTEQLVHEGAPIPRAGLDRLFAFTGNDEIGRPGIPRLPDNWAIRWERFVSKDSPFRDRFARPIDTQLSPPLRNLPGQGGDDLRARSILARLAVRNLLRGYRLALPTGQAVAAALGIPGLTTDELLSGDGGVADALLDGGLVDATPLWFYVLKEAEVQHDGNRLGHVGAHIVCTTLIGQLKADPESYLNREGGAWTPDEGVTFPDGGGGVESIRTFLEFAGVARPGGV